MKPRNHLKIHILCWVIYIFYEIVVAGIIIGRFGNFWEHVIAYSIHISFFYLHAHVILPRANITTTNAIWRVPVVIVCELAVYAFVYASIHLTFRSLLQIEGLSIENVDEIGQQYIAGVLYRAMFFLFPSTGYYFFISTIKKNKEEAARKIQVEQLNSKLLQSELNHLRAQINPHLLFNTLSFIKYNTKHSPETAGKAIMLLSNILDFATRSDSKDHVLLVDEIKQAKHLIELNRLRFGDRLNVDFVYTVHDETISILPLALLTLVENVFKHGNTEDPENPAIIYVNTSADKTFYKTSNIIRNNILSKSSETGLRNIELRLERIYPNRFVFDYYQESDRFNVELCIWN